MTNYSYFDIFVVLLGSVLHVNYISKYKLLLFNQFQQNILICFSNTAHLFNIFKWNIAIYRNIVFTHDTTPIKKDRLKEFLTMPIET